MSEDFCGQEAYAGLICYIETDLGATANLTCMVGSEGPVRLPIHVHTFDTVAMVCNEVFVIFVN